MPLPSTKANTGFTLCFPDVCRSIATPGNAPNPIPYPNFAKTALKGQQKKIAGPSLTSFTGSLVSKQGNEAGTLKNMVTASSMGKATIRQGSVNVIAESESVMLRGTLTQLHNKLSSMSSKDPNEWQKVLQDYAVAASALFMTLNSDDDE